MIEKFILWLSRIAKLEISTANTQLAQKCAADELPWFYNGEFYHITRIDVSRNGRYVLIYGWRI